MTDAMTGLPALDERVPREEIRFGVVLNGGVSLAVWMGGAMLELDRLIKAGDKQAARPNGIYRLLLSLAGATARADVIAGTSAGGINGAALALAQVNQRAEVSSLRDLWVEQGQIETLLRPPFRGAPTSLMKGDDYFLPRLHDALTALAAPVKPDQWRSPAEAPLDLTITATVLNGNQLVTTDSLGQELPQHLHAARFHWKRWANTEVEDDGFSAARLRDTAAQLALAARATASFPVAFEATYIPVRARGGRDDRPVEVTRLRPGMEGVVESWGDTRDDRDRSRFAVDGGLLANTPTRPVLEAVSAMPAEGPVRRVLLLVYPHAPAPGLDPADVEAEPPSLTGALTGLLGALTAQGSRSFVEEVQAHNRVAAGRRGTRSDILDTVRGQGDSGLANLSDTLFPHYVRLRTLRAARDLARRRVDAESRLDAGRRVHAPWNYERVRAAAELAQQSMKSDLPYVPKRPPAATSAPGGPGWSWGVSGAASVAESAGELLRRLVHVLPNGADYLTACAARDQVTKLTAEIADARQGTDHAWDTNEVLLSLAPNESYWRFRLGCYALHMRGVDSKELEDLSSTITQHEESLLPPEDPGARSKRGKDVRGALEPKLAAARDARGVAGDRVKALVDAVVAAVLPVLPVLGRVVAPATTYEGSLYADSRLLAWSEVLLAGGTVPDAATLQTRLLQLEVATTALGDEVSTGSVLPVELVQLSAQTVNPSTRHTRTGDDKLGGMSVNRFGGFLKRSWRVNDWTWGRMDSATTLCRTVLQPLRVRRVALLSGYVAENESMPAAEVKAGSTADALVRELFGASGGGLGAALRDLRDGAVLELTDVFATAEVEPGNLESSMPCLAGLFAWALHLELVPSEMPALVSALEADEVDGSNARSRGRFFLEENKQLLHDVCRAVAEGGPQEVDRRDRIRMLEAFDRAGIGREPLEGELSSDLMIRTATTAAAVGATVLDSPKAGLGALRPLTRALRGSMLVVYWGVVGLTSSAVIARALALLGLALGAVLVTLAAFGAVPAGLAAPAALVGISLVLMAFGFGAVRSGTVLHGLVLLTPLVPLLAEAVSRLRSDTGDDGRYGVTVVTSVIVLALGLMLLGTLPATTHSVFASLDVLAQRRGFRDTRDAQDSGLTRVGKALWRRVLAVASLAVDLGWRLLVLAAPVALAVWVGTSGWLRVMGALRDHALWTVAVAVALVLTGSLAAHWAGTRLRVFALERSADPPAWTARLLAHPGGVQATWAVLYGAAYLALALFLVFDLPGWRDSLWAQALCATAIVLGLVLTLVVPVASPALALRRVVTGEIARAGKAPAFTATRDDLGLTGEGAVPSPAQSFAVDLANRDASFKAWVRVQEGAGLDLTKAGARVRTRVDEARLPHT